MWNPLDSQTEYWNRIGKTKVFGHPVNLVRLKGLLSESSRIVDLGCGQGRVLGILRQAGYRNLVGFDQAAEMVAEARRRLPDLEIETVVPPVLPLADGSADAVLLFAVLTCVPTDAGQRRMLREIERVLRPGGLLYISDLWLQEDDRNRQRYERFADRFGTYGVFELPEGVVVRHHERGWIEQLTQGFAVLALDELEVRTMNGHVAQGFQWFGRLQAGLVSTT